ncbi:chalcone isomerase family protein [Flavobacterium hydatis]|uniref:Chalcone isomerase n=1 Tax=Flavobacterium hydatis TaxID=991 RepID=A0A086ANY1_FLAHY|nr:chalcone isomerase family protein [Flavobacterium hydatis]KFF18395.1 chalcone isomerase [Flavobacterium hydatis]OXA96857.1 chalcone isomerase [Flavobacterium hydatis]
MKNLLLLFTLILTFQASTVTAQKTFTIDGVTIPRTIQFQSKALSLNGGGGKSTMWPGTYLQALYLLQLSQDSKYILDSDSPMAMRIEVTSSTVSTPKLLKAIDDNFKKTYSGNIETLRPKIEEFKSYFMGEINKKTIFKLVYSPSDSSVWIYKNSQLKGKISGVEFKKALFGIWLSKTPADPKLKNQLLGK